MEDDRAKDFFNKNPKNSFEELIEKEKENNSEFLTIEEWVNDTIEKPKEK